MGSSLERPHEELESGALEAAKHPAKCLGLQQPCTAVDGRAGHGEVPSPLQGACPSVLTVAWAVLYRKPGAGPAGEEAGIGGPPRP